MIETARDNKNDVFICGTFLPDFNELIYLSKKCKTAVVLPSKLYPSTKNLICVCCENFNRINPEAELIFFDIALAEDEFFRTELIKNKIQRLIIPFACFADECEYGYSGKYFKLGDLKQCSAEFIQTVALFPRKYELDNFATVFSVDDCVVFDAADSMPFRTVESNNSKDSFGLAFKEICKKAGEKSLVYFPERTSATDFSKYCASRGEYVPVITGKSSCDEIRRYAGELLNGKCRAIAGTKSMLPLYILVNADNAVVCGLPFSENYFQIMLLTAIRGVSVFSKEDYVSAKKLIGEYCDKYVPVFHDSIYKEKIRRLDVGYELYFK